MRPETAAPHRNRLADTSGSPGRRMPALCRRVRRLPRRPYPTRSGCGRAARWSRRVRLPWSRSPRRPAPRPPSAVFVPGFGGSRRIPARARCPPGRGCRLMGNPPAPGRSGPGCQIAPPWPLHRCGARGLVAIWAGSAWLLC
ncbi:Uncharacterised protein [Mycobacteroides abscessus subsp. massiliense]|nr:Uncharacterised protein [Mycobacteroides abscessus subsp. massiliense]